MHPQTVPYRPHNDLLWIWSEMGVVGFVAFIWLVVQVLRLGWQRLQETSDGIEWALLSGIIAVVVNGLFGFPRVFPGAWLPFWLCVVGMGVLNAGREIAWPSLRWGISLGILVTIVSGIGIIRQIGFDRHFLQTRLAFAQHQWPRVIDTANQALAFGAFDEEVLMIPPIFFFSGLFWVIEFFVERKITKKDKV